MGGGGRKRRRREEGEEKQRRSSSDFVNVASSPFVFATRSNSKEVLDAHDVNRQRRNLPRSEQMKTKKKKKKKKSMMMTRDGRGGNTFMA